MLQDRKILFVLFLFLIFISSCATTTTTTTRTGGVYHSVKKGETLWRIAKAYNCDPDEIARANNLSDSTIEAGSALFIPNAAQTIEITPGTPSTHDKAASKKKRPARVHEENLRPVRSEPTPASNSKIPSVEKPSASTGASDSSSPGFIWPLLGNVSLKFGVYKGMQHNGIKIDGKEGTPVLSSADGTVTYAAPMKYFGETIIIKHNETYSTVYSQLKKRLIETGTSVKKGDKIGLVGTEETGKSRLHFEIRRKNRAIDPLRYLPKNK